MSAYEQLLAPVLPLARLIGVRRGSPADLAIRAARRLVSEGAESFSAREVHARLVRDGHDVQWVKVRRAVHRGLAGREGRLPAVFVEVTPGRYRFRAGEPVSAWPLEVAEPSAAPAMPTLPPRGSRAAILKVAADLAQVHPDGHFRLQELVHELGTRGYPYTRLTIQDTVGRMCGGARGRKALLWELERIGLGVYRLQPQGPEPPRYAVPAPEPAGCRRGILEVGALLASADPGRVFRVEDLLREFEKRGAPWAARTVRRTLSRMAGGPRGHRTRWHEVDRVAAGVYRLVRLESPGEVQASAR